MDEHESSMSGQSQAESRRDFFGALVNEHEASLQPTPEQERQAELQELYAPVAGLLRHVGIDKVLDSVDGGMQVHFDQGSDEGLRYTEIPLLDDKGNEVDPSGAEVKVYISGTAVVPTPLAQRGLGVEHGLRSAQGFVRLGVKTGEAITKKPRYGFEMSFQPDGTTLEDVKLFLLDTADSSQQIPLEPGSGEFKELCNIVARLDEFESGEFVEGTNPEVIRAEKQAAREAREKAIIETEEALDKEARVRLEVQARYPETQRKAIEEWIDRNVDNVREQIREEKALKSRRERE